MTKFIVLVGVRVPYAAGPFGSRARADQLADAVRAAGVQTQVIELVAGRRVLASYQPAADPHPSGGGDRK